jgi:hypothetical protein
MTLQIAPVHVSLAFAKFDDADTIVFANGVVDLMLKNIAYFTGPTVPLASISAAILSFEAAITAKAQQGSAATEDKKNKKAFLVNLLRTQAGYVQNLFGVTKAIVLLSGFTTTDQGHHAAVNLVPPVILGMTNPAPGQFGVGLQGSPGATGYDLQVSVDGAPPVPCGHFSSTRNIVVIDMKSGSMCALQARSCAGNNQVSAWSDPVSHRST